jgi:hypothetical protein
MAPPSLSWTSYVTFPRLASIVIAIAALAAGCSDSDPTDVTDEVTIADLVGSWTASSHTFQNNANAAESHDVVADGGETRTTVLANGGARTWLDWGTYQDEWDAQLTINGSTLTSTPVESTRETRTWTMTLEGSVLTLSRATSTFDFTLVGGTGVSATEVVVFVRQ